MYICNVCTYLHCSFTAFWGGLASSWTTYITHVYRSWLIALWLPVAMMNNILPDLLWCILSWGQRVHHHLSHVTPFVMCFGPHLLHNRFSGTSIVMHFAGHLLHNRFSSTLHSLPISRCFAYIHVHVAAAVVTLDVRPQVVLLWASCELPLPPQGTGFIVINCQLVLYM